MLVSLLSPVLSLLAAEGKSRRCFPAHMGVLILCKIEVQVTRIQI